MSAKRLSVVKEWVCPQCGKTDQTADPRPHTRMHVCPKLYGLTAPMVEQGQRARLVMHEREDYVKHEEVTLTPEDKRPVMSLETQYDDGHTDLRVYAPRASSTIHDHK